MESMIDTESLPDRPLTEGEFEDFVETRGCEPSPNEPSSSAFEAVNPRNSANYAGCAAFCLRVT
jgi:hypothetical protein